MDTLTIFLLVILIMSVWGLIVAVLCLAFRSGTESGQISALQTEMNALR